jgi:hypothetical protein
MQLVSKLQFPFKANKNNLGFFIGLLSYLSLQQQQQQQQQNNNDRLFTTLLHTIQIKFVIQNQYNLILLT